MKPFVITEDEIMENDISIEELLARIEVLEHENAMLKS